MFQTTITALAILPLLALVPLGLAVSEGPVETVPPPEAMELPEPRMEPWVGGVPWSFRAVYESPSATLTIEGRPAGERSPFEEAPQAAVLVDYDLAESTHFDELIDHVVDGHARFIGYELQHGNILMQSRSIPLDLCIFQGALGIPATAVQHTCEGKTFEAMHEDGTTSLVASHGRVWYVFDDQALPLALTYSVPVVTGDRVSFHRQYFERVELEVDGEPLSRSPIEARPLARAPLEPYGPLDEVGAPGSSRAIYEALSNDPRRWSWAPDGVGEFEYFVGLREAQELERDYSFLHTTTDITGFLTHMEALNGSRILRFDPHASGFDLQRPADAPTAAAIRALQLEMHPDARDSPLSFVHFEGASIYHASSFDYWDLLSLRNGVPGFLGGLMGQVPSLNYEAFFLVDGVEALVVTQVADA